MSSNTSFPVSGSELSLRAYDLVRDYGIIETTKIVGLYALQRFKLLSYRNHLQNKFRYAKPAPPYRTIFVDPAEVAYRSMYTSRNHGLGQVRSGDWDISECLGLIDEYQPVIGLRERFQENKDWENTQYVCWAEKKLSEQESFLGCEDVNEFVQKRCRYVDDIYEDILNNGYRPETSQKSGENKKYRDRDLYSQQLEPLILIGRDGNIIWREGFHRFTIAEVLDIKIPVQVLCRHESWQLWRDELYNQSLDGLLTESHPTLLEHPDMRDIVHRQA